MEREIVIESDKNTVANSYVCCDKHNIKKGHAELKLLRTFSLISFLFVFGCNQRNGGDEQQKPIPKPSEESAKYIVEHWQENIEDEKSTLREKEEKRGKAGKTTEAEPRQYDGFTTQPFEQVQINKDGSTVVQIKYKRNIISLILNLDEGTTTPTLEDGDAGKKILKGKFEAQVEVKGLHKENHTFQKWEPELPKTFPSTSPSTVYVAKWTTQTIPPKDEVTHTVDAVNFKMKLIKEVENAVLGDNSQSNNKEHKVSLSSYYIGETEVTQELWKAVMDNNPSNSTDSPKNPVEKVTWFDCINFCNKLTEKMMGKEHCVYTINGKEVTADFSKKGFRLPTEAEWEYAAMGGEKSKYAGCNDESELSSYAWYKANSDNKPHQVETKQANKFGLFDMSGNVWEWCWDWYDGGTPTEGKDPVGAVSGVDRIIRGGSWRSVVSDCGCSSRLSDYPDVSYNHLGLRLACRP